MLSRELEKPLIDIGTHKQFLQLEMGNPRFLKLLPMEVQSHIHNEVNQTLLRQVISRDYAAAHPCAPGVSAPPLSSYYVDLLSTQVKVKNLAQPFSDADCQIEEGFLQQQIHSYFEVLGWNFNENVPNWNEAALLVLASFVAAENCPDTLTARRPHNEYGYIFKDLEKLISHSFYGPILEKLRNEICLRVGRCTFHDLLHALDQDLRRPHQENLADAVGAQFYPSMLVSVLSRQPRPEPSVIEDLFANFIRAADPRTQADCVVIVKELQAVANRLRAVEFSDSVSLLEEELDGFLVRRVFKEKYLKRIKRAIGCLGLLMIPRDLPLTVKFFSVATTTLIGMSESHEMEWLASQRLLSGFTVLQLLKRKDLAFY